jgi:hypothetical protein
MDAILAQATQVLECADDYAMNSIEGDMLIVYNDMMIFDRLLGSDPHVDTLMLANIVIDVLDAHDDIVSFLMSNNYKPVSTPYTMNAPAMVGVQAGGKRPRKKRGGFDASEMAVKILIKIMLKSSHVTEHISHGILDAKGAALFTHFADKSIDATRLEDARKKFFMYLDPNGAPIPETAQMLRQMMRVQYNSVVGVKIFHPHALPEYSNIRTLGENAKTRQDGMIAVTYRFGDAMFDIWAKAGVSNAFADLLVNNLDRRSRFFRNLSTKLKFGGSAQSGGKKSASKVAKTKAPAAKSTRSRSKNKIV